MKKTSIMTNYLYNLSYQLLVILFPIITTPYLARILGAEGTGIYSYVLSITTYFILFGTLGISLFGQREIAYVSEDKTSRSILFWELMGVKIITMLFAIILFYILYGTGNEYSVYFRILIIEMIANLIDINWFYQGIENFKKSSLRNIFVKIIFVICIFLFVKTKDDVDIYLFLYSITSFLGNAALWIGLNKYIQKVPISSLNLKKRIKPILIVFIPQISIQIYTVLDKTMIGLLTNDMFSVGYYEETQKIIKTLLTIITALGAVLLPKISKCYSNKENGQIEKYMYKTFRFVYFLSFAFIFGIIAVSKNFVPLFFGEGYEEVIKLLRLLCPIILFIGLSNIIGVQYLLSTKKEFQFSLSVIGGAIINIVLNFFLIPKYTGAGAVLSTVFAEFVVLSIQLYFIKNSFSLKKIVSISKNYFIASILMFGVCCIFPFLINNSYFCILIQVLVGSICYFGILLFFKDEMLIYILQKGKEIIKKIH